MSFSFFSVPFPSRDRHVPDLRPGTLCESDGTFSFTSTSGLPSFSRLIFFFEVDKAPLPNYPAWVKPVMRKTLPRGVHASTFPLTRFAPTFSPLVSFSASQRFFLAPRLTENPMYSGMAPTRLHLLISVNRPFDSGSPEFPSSFVPFGTHVPLLPINCQNNEQPLLLQFGFFFSWI